MVLNMKVHIKTGKKTGKEFYYLQIRANIWGNSSTMKYQVMGNTTGVMEKFIKGSGKIIR